MRLSAYFLPTMKETPSEAQIMSHRLMLRAGMIRQSSAGIYSWLPLGLKVLERIKTIVREEQNRAGAQELLMPTIQSADLWQESGRYDDYGKEMLRITDRHDRNMLFGPTNEELITDIFRQAVRSYKNLPLNLYHIQWKFRDEIRPRFGVMRGREFLMKDAYSFDKDENAARISYNKMFAAYLRTFRRMGLKAIPMRADTGPIGGNLSHEFIILAETGESEVFCHQDYLEKDVAMDPIEDPEALQAYVDAWTCLYAATEDMHDASQYDASVPKESQINARGIEVGHVFYFGTKYSEAMNAKVSLKEGGEAAVHMGSYGIGVSRLVGAVIEACHDDNGIIWPESVAPFDFGLIKLKAGDANLDTACDDLYCKLTSLGWDVLYDDRDDRPGAKFATMDLIGLPWQIILGPKGLAAGKIELKRRVTGEREEISIEDLLNRFGEKQGGA